jgi:uncharacterized delta-60 repeat protein
VGARALALAAAAIALASSALVLSSAGAVRADFVLDPTFGVNGVSILEFGSVSSAGTDIVVQPDGRIVAAGHALGNVDFERYIVMTRHHPNGIVDSSFSGDGSSLTRWVYRDQANAIALQGDGKIVAVGQHAVSNSGSAKSPSIYRFNSDGSIDSAFADNGQIAIRYPSD